MSMDHCPFAVLAPVDLGRSQGVGMRALSSPSQTPLTATSAADHVPAHKEARPTGLHKPVRREFREHARPKTVNTP